MKNTENRNTVMTWNLKIRKLTKIRKKLKSKKKNKKEVIKTKTEKNWNKKKNKNLWACPNSRKVGP